MDAMQRLTGQLVADFAAVLGRPREGQAMPEYALILAGVAAVTIVAMDQLSDAIGALLTRIAASLS